MPAGSEIAPMLPGLSPLGGGAMEACFDDAQASSDGGLLLLREVELRLGMARRMAECIRDPRAPERVPHRLDEILHFRMLMIAAGYEEGDDADTLRRDSLFKLTMQRLPDEADLWSQPTVSRTENLPDARALLRLGRAMVDYCCDSFRQVPRRIVLDVDDTFDAVHGGQKLRLFNAHRDEYGFQPIVLFDGGAVIAAVLRPACRPDGRQTVRWPRRLIAALRADWPRVGIMLRADSHYCTPAVPRVGIVSSASSPASRPGRRGWTRASSSPAAPVSAGAPSIRTSTARPVRPRTTSGPGKPISPPTTSHVVVPAPSRCVCFCTSAPTG
jgi:hypothetical protein